jgi:Holliday junction resolvase RusA-like endonuclease
MTPAEVVTQETGWQTVTTFGVAGVQKAKGRARVTRRGFAYTPQKTREAEENFLAQAVQHAPASPITGPVLVLLWFFLPIPQSWSRKKRELAASGAHMPTGKPDIDNLAKLCLDAMNGTFWVDDSQIVEIKLRKKYTSERPGVYVEVMRWGPDGVPA